MSLQVCHCGWSKSTTYQGLRIHQGKMGCTPKGMGIPEAEQFRFNSFLPNLTYMEPPVKVKEPLRNIFIGSKREQYTWENDWEESRQKDTEPVSWTTPVKKENGFVSPNNTSTEAVIQLVKSCIENNQQKKSDQSGRALDFISGVQSPLMPVTQIVSSQANPAAAKETSGSVFETPPQHNKTRQTATNARRALDFSTGAEQVEQLLWDPPTTTAQQTANQPKQNEEAQKLKQVKRDRIKADLQQKIQMREEKMAEVKSSVKACKGGLDAEWVEINNVFSEVMRVVEEARKKALQPLEERRKQVKREAQDLGQKLQKEIDKLKKTIDELDDNSDLHVSPLTGLDEWKDVNTSFSFGSLRATTSEMMEQIHQKVEKLSSVELKRIPSFAVDVKLDPTTAHRWLVLSSDGKTVRDGGENQRVPDAPQRFDMFGSILGLNRLTSGKSYWEVEVTNKTGWDLGVARRDVNRKGKLSLNSDNGYWVIVHYEDDKYAALTAPPVRLALKEKPQKVGVFVDYEEGLVSFYDVSAQSHIHSFTGCSFSDGLIPYFSPHLKQNGKNSDPLIISAVKKQQRCTVGFGTQ